MSEEVTANKNNFNTDCGWTCPNCGTWVSPGTYHTCYGTPNTYPQATTIWRWDYSALLERIAVALERIADSLDVGSKGN